MRRCLLAALVWMGGSVEVGWAQPPETSLTVGVRLDDESRRPLLTRIRGQLSDVNAQVIGLETEPLEASFREQVDRARRVGTELVVWVTRSHVVILEREQRLLFRRPIGDGSTLATSASLEQAALIVRTAVLEVLEGRSVGEAEAEVIAVAEAEAEAEAEAGSQGPGVTDPQGNQERGDAADEESGEDGYSGAGAGHALEPLVGLGWWGRIDGEGSAGAHGGFLRVGAASTHWSVALRLQLGIPLRLSESNGVVVSFARQDISAEAAGRLPLSQLVALGGAITAGAWAGRRSTEEVAPSLVATDSRWLFGALAGVEVRMWVRVVSAFELEFGLGADLLLPTLDFTVDGTGNPPQSIWTVQPRASVGLNLML